MKKLFIKRLWILFFTQSLLLPPPVFSSEDQSPPSELEILINEIITVTDQAASAVGNLFEKWQKEYFRSKEQEQESSTPSIPSTPSTPSPPSIPSTPSIQSISSLPSIEEQIEQQIGPNLLDPSFLDRSQIIKKLEEDFNISIQTDDPSILNKYLLSYLYNYFQWMLPDERVDGSVRIRSPYYLHARNRFNRQMVERDGAHIYFSKNAGHKTITAQFHEAMSTIFNSKNETLPSEIQVTFEYDNELYSQFNDVFLDSKDIQDFMYLQTGIVFHLEETDPDYHITQEFTQEELLLVLKQFLDLPVHIRDSLALKKIIRMAEGYQPPTAILTIVVGLYSFKDQTIQLFDPAFDESPEGDDAGEGVILHEIAHALWGKSLWQAFPQHLREEYQSLSWEGDEIIGEEFISEYSTKNIHEDFAEHFSMYMDNPERLLHKTPGKYQWLKDNVFVNTEYFSGPALDNLQIFVHSEMEDIEPPYLLEEQSKLTVKESKPFNSNSSIAYAVNLGGLFDDISGVSEINLRFESDDDFLNLSGKNFRDTHEGEKCESAHNCNLFDSNNPGDYSFIAQRRLDFQVPGIYKLDTISFEDYAGNERTIHNTDPYFGAVEFYVPGTRKKKDDDDNYTRTRYESFSQYQAQYIKDNMEVILGNSNKGGTSAVFLLPDILSPKIKMDKIEIELKGKDTERKLRFVIDMDELDNIASRFESVGVAVPLQTGFLSAPVLVPSYLPSEQYDVVSIKYETTSAEEDGIFTLKCNNECFQFQHNTSQADHTYPQAVAEDIVLSVLETTNDEGGISILAQIPVTGFEERRLLGEDGYNIVFQHAKLRSPRGNIISDNKTIPDSDGNLQFQFDLKPHHEQGNYILSSVTLKEGHSSEIGHLYGWQIHGEDYETRDRLLRRGIRKIITISIPPYQEEDIKSPPLL